MGFSPDGELIGSVRSGFQESRWDAPELYSLTCPNFWCSLIISHPKNYKKNVQNSPVSCSCWRPSQILVSFNLTILMPGPTIRFPTHRDLHHCCNVDTKPWYLPSPQFLQFTGRIVFQSGEAAGFQRSTFCKKWSPLFCNPILNKQPALRMIHHIFHWNAIVFSFSSPGRVELWVDSSGWDPPGSWVHHRSKKKIDESIINLSIFHSEKLHEKRIPWLDISGCTDSLFSVGKHREDMTANSGKFLFLRWEVASPKKKLT